MVEEVSAIGRSGVGVGARRGDDESDRLERGRGGQGGSRTTAYVEGVSETPVQKIGNALTWGATNDAPAAFVWEIGHTSPFTSPAAAFCLLGRGRLRYSDDAPGVAGPLTADPHRLG